MVRANYVFARFTPPIHYFVLLAALHVFLILFCVDFQHLFSSMSPIYDFYPEDFATDMNGKTNEWEAVVLIPFIDEVSSKFVDFGFQLIFLKDPIA